MHNRRFLAVTVGLLMGLTGTASASPAHSAMSAAVQASAAGKKVVFIQEITANVFSDQESCGAQAEARKLGLKYSTTGPSTFSASAQTPYVNAVAAEHPAGVLIGPDDATAMQAPMMAMKQEGIKLVELDTSLNNKSVSLSHISSNNASGGALAADETGKVLGGHGVVLVLSLAPGVSTDDQRIQGFKQEIKAKFPGISLLPTQYDNNSTGTAASIVSSTLIAHPKLAAIFATDLTNVEGASTGLVDAHNTSVKLIGFDAAPLQVTMLREGKLYAVVSQNPFLMGEDGVQQLYNAFTGAHVTGTIITPLGIVTGANVSSPSVAHFLYRASC
jgi:ribose transport system substrate-binding protein